mmetsp:Transcript_17865/g.29353  ORF Transcript_17865/g.29353 Transcript_17865/m.29353 type:complete len:745 (-) Transcript_17865:56-2290(-)
MASSKDTSSADAVPKIYKLDEDVVNRIAAGEIIVRPASALKELIENSLDAGSTSISILVQHGGLKLLQIQDNGHGINRGDFPILCERFTTSKIRKYEDLRSIGTFGFRGEALASITHVAHVSITSMTPNQTCAYKASFMDGKLVPAKAGENAEPKACAGVRGTIITVEDLFFNVPTRKKALRSATEEYQKIIDVVGRYAVQYPGVAMTCKKQGESTADVHTSVKGSRLDNIRSVFGAALAREVLTFDCEDKDLAITATGYVSNANYSMKKSLFVLFINNRLVDCSALKKALEGVYATYLPKHTHPFVFLSLHINPLNVDVNVHPTKSEVRFLHEDEIINSIREALETRLTGGNASRTFLTQTLLVSSASQNPAAVSSSSSSSCSVSDADQPPAQSQPVLSLSLLPDSQRETAKPLKIAPQKLVRTDAYNPAGSLDQYVVSTANSKSRNSMAMTGNDDLALVTSQGADGEGDLVARPPPRKKSRVMKTVSLSSVKELIADIDLNSHVGLTTIIRNQTFVGMVDNVFSLIQSGTKLYLVDTPLVWRELLYQSALRMHSNFGRLRLQTPAPLRLLVRSALDLPTTPLEVEPSSRDEATDDIVNHLLSKGEMLNEYYRMELAGEGSDDAVLRSLPILVEGHVPPMAALPLFLVALAAKVDWEEEKACFNNISDQLADFYATPPPPNSNPISNCRCVTMGPQGLGITCVQHVVLPAIQKHLRPPSCFVQKGVFLQVAALENLYKVFERC